eukprot:1383385-Amorphochlora_amoeboformis.AAC.2
MRSQNLAAAQVATRTQTTTFVNVNRARSTSSRSVCASATSKVNNGMSGRRQALGQIAIATVATPLAANAGLFGPPQREVYEKETSAFLKQLKDTLAMPSDDEGKKDAVLALKTEGNRWVAKWRNSKMSSSPSFGNLYSVVNAVNGHYNTFGPNSNLPKKRMARVDKEIEDANKYLLKGR